MSHRPPPMRNPSPTSMYSRAYFKTLAAASKFRRDTTNAGFICAVDTIPGGFIAMWLAR